MVMLTTTTFAPVDPAKQRRLMVIVKRMDDLTEERDKLIREMRDEGGSLREIALYAGMTHMGIKKLLERNEPDPDPRDEVEHVVQ